MAKITKALIPAAGFGTRFLPQTKAMPKEMLPLVDKPIIQRVVEELAEAGIETIIIVTGWNKRNLEDHFDNNSELEALLEKSGKQKELDEVRRISSLAEFVYVRQKGPYGNGTPILNVKHIMKDEPFLMMWGDDFIDAEPSRAKQLIEAYEKNPGVIIGGIRKDGDDDYKRYGYVGGEVMADGVIKATHVIEKPGSRENAPSNLASMSGFVITPNIYSHLEKARDNLQQGNELWYMDGFKGILEEGGPIFAIELQNAKYCDTGNKLEYLKTVVEYGMKHPEIGEEFKEFLKNLPD